jgi:hypothetical protein
MTTKYIILLTLFLPAILFGQSKNCNYAYEQKKAISCYLTPVSKVKDTIVSILPKDCNLIQFDSTANGNWKIYSADTMTLLEIVGVQHGQRNGTNIIFHSNGQIHKKANYKNNKLTGDFVSFFENHKIYMEGYYKLDKENNEVFIGTKTKYWDNGSIAQQFILKDNSSQADSKFWDKDGKVLDYYTFTTLWFDCE